MAELRGLRSHSAGSTTGGPGRPAPPAARRGRTDADWEEEEEEEEDEGGGEGAADEEEEDEDNGIVRSGQVCILGVPNSGKSSLVNALVGAKISIVSPKPQTTRQRVLGIALLASEPDAPPDTQAVFFDTAGIMNMSAEPSEVGGPYRRRAKQLFPRSVLHKAMVKTAWKSTRDADALWWVLDAGKCFKYGDYMPEQAMLDGIPVGPPVRDSWWSHPEMEEELAFMRRLKKMKRPVHVVLNKMDLLQEANADINRFTATMRKRLLADLGTDKEGEPLLQNMWPTSVLKDPESLEPLKAWLCQNLPERRAMYPLEALSDVPARVLASEITREKLFAVLRQELPYKTAVVNMVWREEDDGSLMLGQRIVVMTEGQERIVRGWLRHITEDAEKEISETLNSGRPVRLHFQTAVDPKWQSKQDFYSDVNGILLSSGSLLFPED